MQFDWAVTSGGGSIAPGSLGHAIHTLGEEDGDQTVTAGLSGLEDTQQVIFTAKAFSELVSVYSEGYSTKRRFFPQDIVLTGGKTVAWAWTCDPFGDYYYYGCYYEAHNITFEDDPNPPASSTAKNSGMHFRWFDTTPRTIRYRCTIHSTSFTEGMVGTVTIQ